MMSSLALLFLTTQHTPAFFCHPPKKKLIIENANRHFEKGLKNLPTQDW